MMMSWLKGINGLQEDSLVKQTSLKLFFRLKANDIDSEKPDEILTTLNADVDFALKEYNDSKSAEKVAEERWEQRKLLDGPARPSVLNETQKKLLTRKTKDYYKRYKKLMNIRFKNKKLFDERLAAKEKHQTDSIVTERRENWVYKDGANYNVRWSSLPQ